MGVGEHRGGGSGAPSRRGRRLAARVYRTRARQTEQSYFSGSPRIESSRASPVPEGWLRRSSFTKGLLFKPRRRCNPLSPKPLRSFSSPPKLHQEFGIEPILG